MKKTFVKMFGCVALAVASIVALNACSGENGVDGKDGADGKDGVSVTDTLYIFQKDTVFFAGDTIYISQKDTVLVKDTVILAGDTIVISKNDTVVVNNRDTVYIENGGSGSGNGGAETGGNTSFGSLIDERDGQTYRATKIGDQVWMAENLNFPVKGSYCYNRNLVNCETYGRLYEWAAAQDACPSGWHLPSKDDFEMLQENVCEKKGGDSMGELNCIELKARRWSFRTDTYGFSALPAGYYYGNENKFYSLDVDACFWSSTATYYLSVLNGTFYSGKSNNGYSVRCLQDSN